MIRFSENGNLLYDDGKEVDVDSPVVISLKNTGAYFICKLDSVDLAAENVYFSNPVSFDVAEDGKAVTVEYIPISFNDVFVFEFEEIQHVVKPLPEIEKYYIKEYLPSKEKFYNELTGETND